MMQLTEVTLPPFGAAESCPEIPVEIYRTRLAAAVEGMAKCGWDALVVYGDREHSANMAYLTGFDPRFEEAVLLLTAEGKTALLVGNECMGYLPDAQLGIEVEMFQDFSLMGQPRGQSRPLRAILSDFGIRPGTRVGCAGWKAYDPALVPETPQAIDAPSYLVDLLRDLAGGTENVTNAVPLFADPQDGLRLFNEPEQIAAYEYASTRTSDAVRNLLAHLREGVSEQELTRFLDPGSLPLSCHLMVSFGEKARRGLASPSANRAAPGDTYTVGFGVAGALTSRAGIVARGPQDLSPQLQEFFPAYAANYFEVVATWYEHVRVGAVTGEVFEAVEAARDPKLYDFAVNPGHYIHLDEWVCSPFVRGSDVELRSSAALQMDIIPISRGPFCYVNTEDGIVLADAALRETLSRRFPQMWSRIEARRRFMIDTLGLTLDESVLPLSNIPAWMPLYALNAGRVLVRA